MKILFILLALVTASVQAQEFNDYVRQDGNTLTFLDDVIWWQVETPWPGNRTVCDSSNNNQTCVLEPGEYKVFGNPLGQHFIKIQRPQPAGIVISPMLSYSCQYNLASLGVTDAPVSTADSEAYLHVGNRACIATCPVGEKMLSASCSAHENLFGGVDLIMAHALSMDETRAVCQTIANRLFLDLDGISIRPNPWKIAINYRCASGI